MIYTALPLFNPTDNFTQLLEFYAACNCSPCSDHPALQDWLGIGYTSNSFTPSQPSGSFAIPPSPHKASTGNAPSYLSSESLAEFTETGGAGWMIPILVHENAPFFFLIRGYFILLYLSIPYND